MSLFGRGNMVPDPQKHCGRYSTHEALKSVSNERISLTCKHIGDKLRLGNEIAQLLLPHSVKRIYPNDGSGAPLVRPDVFLCYAILHECSPEFWVMNLHVLGKIILSYSRWKASDSSLCSNGMGGPPRDLPQLNLEGLIVLPEHTAQSDAEEVLKAFDQLALHYTRQTITHDRKLYLEWAHALSRKSQETDGIVATHLQDKHEALFELTRRVGTAQKEIMVTSTAAVEQLFTDDLMRNVYEHPPFVGSVFDETVAWVVDLVKNAVNSGKQVVRVLEVGAGTSRLTALLGRALQPIYPNAQEAAAKCPWPNVTAKALDLNVPVNEQHVDPRSFDIVVAFDVLHATPDIHVSLVTVKDLLCSGGHAVVLELDANSFASGAIGTTWMDFIFGSFQEWFGVLETRTGSVHCTLSASQWENALGHAGFSDTLLLTSASAAVAHLAFICRSNGEPLSTRHLLGNKALEALSSASSPSPPLPPYSEIDSRLLNESFVSLVQEKKTGIMGDYAASEQPLSASTDVGEQNVILRHFTAGAHPYTLWLYTDMKASNAAVLGLARTLRREYPTWTIYTAIFPSSWNVAEQEVYVRPQLLALPWVDSEVMIDVNGTICMPRIVKAASCRM
ncbi:S-adenosyl-L-methionine-dependent methyltransferase [Melanogaster broomeanus]|nr:S-adenosyl-L-methionine-dependent methyltransferase [Melanogaster broomeanus]